MCEEGRRKRHRGTFILRVGRWGWPYWVRWLLGILILVVPLKVEILPIPHLLENLGAGGLLVARI